MAAGYRLLSYQAPAGGRRAGILVGDRVHDAGYESVLDALADWPRAASRLRERARAPQDVGVPLAEAALLAPILHPGQIFCAGANYADHVREMSRAMNLPPEPDPRDLGLAPWHFIKTGRGSVVGPGARTRMPSYSAMVDWEAEIAAVIGRPARNVDVAHALDHVAGYTIANDLSARDHVKRPHVNDASPFKFDWMSHKCFEDACPMGPWITPAEDIPDPQALAIRLSVNGETMQDSSSAQMIFTVAEQVAHLSTRVTLFPGDVVLTGTPAGVGAARRRFLAPGDTVRIDVERIGTLVHTMTAA